MWPLTRRQHQASETEPPLRGMQAMRESQAVLQALLEASPGLASLDDPDQVIERCCELIVNSSPRIKLAWFWRGPSEAEEMRPMVLAGPAADRAFDLVVQCNLWTRPGSAWRITCGDPEIDAAIGLPLAMPEGDCGVLVVHAPDRNYFDSVGAEPFAAFARFAEVALAQIDARRRLCQVADTDPLTGQHNRRAMSELLEQLHQQAGHSHSRLSVVMLDIDHFKAINDRFGHQAGDKVLQEVARCLKMQLRAEDHLARWGGEEFLAVLPGADAESVRRVTERLRQGVESLRVRVGNTEVGVTCSLGVASCGPRMASLDRLIREADSALYRAKRGGRNRVCEAVTAPA
jgi:diguanylate cyclase (GGDEF)-like protein